MKTFFKDISSHIKNSNFLTAFILISGNVILEAFADMFMKKGMNSVGIEIAGVQNIPEFIVANLMSPLMVLGIFLYLVSFVIWITALHKVELSIAYPISSTSYMLVPLISIIFLRETVPLLRWVGIMAIIAGIIVISRSRANRSGVDDNGA